MDVENYLKDKEIEYKTDGKNISDGWIGISCLFCGDHAEHLGINKTNGYFTCWLCSENGNFINLVKKIENCSYYEAKNIAKKYDYENVSYVKEIEIKKYIGKVLPPECSEKFLNIHLNYLKNRNFNPHELIKRWKLQSVHTVGKYKFRIIAPVIVDNQVVNFVACDASNKADVPYLFASNKKSIMPINSCLYGADSIKSEVIICEGVTDVWRIGENSISTFGKVMTKNQVVMLLKKEVTRAIIIPDSDAINAGYRTAELLSGIIDDVELVILQQGDPADLTTKEVNELLIKLDLK